MFEPRREYSNPVPKIAKYLTWLEFALQNVWSCAKVTLILLQVLLHKFKFVEEDLDYGSGAFEK